MYLVHTCRHMAAQEAQMTREFSESLQQGMPDGMQDMWGFPPEDMGRGSGGARSPQQIWGSMNARDKRDLTRKVMARRTPTQAQVGFAGEGTEAADLSSSMLLSLYQCQQSCSLCPASPQWPCDCLVRTVSSCRNPCM